MCGYWNWAYDEDGLSYEFICDGTVAARVWLSRGGRWEDDEWTVWWAGRTYWTTPIAEVPATREDAFALAEAFLRHPERFPTPRSEREARQAARNGTPAEPR